jgi:glycosyltransferase involved in cell wall biosynthesis
VAAVSVVIPTFNRSELVRQAISSAINQTSPPDQIIVVDDGSTDDTAQVVRAFGSAVKYVHQENGGVGRARNTGVAHARGEYILFLDSDDTLRPQAIEHLASALERSPTAGMAYGQAQVTDLNGKQLQIQQPSFRRPPGTWDGARELEHLLLRNYLRTSAILINRRAWDEIGGFDPRCGNMGEDWDAWVRIARQWPIAYMPEVVVTARHHPTSLSSAATERMRGTARRTYDHILQDTLSDPKIGSSLKRHRRRFEAFHRFHFATLAYAGHDVRAARAQLRRAIRLYPQVLVHPEAAGVRTLCLKLMLPRALSEAARSYKHSKNSNA